MTRLKKEMIILVTLFIFFQAHILTLGATNSYNLNFTTSAYNNFSMYLPANAPSLGSYIYTNSQAVNTLSNLRVRPYSITFNYSMHMGNLGGWWPSQDSAPTITFYSCNSDGTIISQVAGLSGAGNSTSGSFTIPANQGVYLAVHIGCCRAAFGYSADIPCFIDSLTFKTDSNAPNQPSNFAVKDDYDGGLYLNNKIVYSKYSPITLIWDPSTDSAAVSGDPVSGIDGYLLRCNGKEKWLTQNSYTDNNIELFPNDGSYTVDLISKDKEGNISNTTSLVLNVDRSINNVSLTANPIQITPQSNGKYSIKLIWNPLGDLSGIKNYVVSLSNSSDAPGNQILVDGSQTSYTFTDIDYSNHTLYAFIQAIDNVRNMSGWTKTIGFQVYSPPTTISALPHSTVVNNNPSYKVSLSIPKTETYQYIIEREGDTTRDIITLPSSTKDPLVFVDDVNLLRHGHYRYSVYTKNSYGVVSSKSYSDYIMIPNIPVSGLSLVIETSQGRIITQDNINSNSLVFQTNLTQDAEGDIIKYRIGYKNLDIPNDPNHYSSDILQTGNITVNNLSDGHYAFWMEYAEYDKNNFITDAISTTPTILNVDTTAPTGSFLVKSNNRDRILDQNNPTNSPNVLITDIQYNDPGINPSGVKGIYLWNGTSQTPPEDTQYYAIVDIPSGGIPWSLPNGPDGYRTVTLGIADNAGNLGLATYKIQLDMTKPNFPHNVTHSYSGTTLTVNWEEADYSDLAAFKGSYALPGQSPVSFECQISQDGKGNIQIVVPDTLFNQPISFTIAAVDKAGNQSESQNQLIYTPAKLGAVQFLGATYDRTSGRYQMKWQLTDIGIAKTHILEFGEQTADGFIQTSIIQPVNGIFIHDSGASGAPLQAHTIYNYRLVAINDSDDQTLGPPFTEQVTNQNPTAPVLVAPLQYARGDVEFIYQPAQDNDPGDILTYHVFMAEGIKDPDTDSTSFKDIGGNTIAELQNGQAYTWYVEVDDNCGGSTKSLPAHFTVDTVAPALAVEKPHQPYTNQTQLAVTATDDLSGLESLTYQKIDVATNQKIAEGAIDFVNGVIPLTEGAYHLFVTAKDKAGNSTNVNLNNLQVDQTVPELHNFQIGLSSAENRYFLGDLRLPATWDANDSSSGIAYLRYWLVKDQGAQLDQGNNIPLSSNLSHYAYTLTLSGQQGEDYYLAVAVEDKAGNRSAVQYEGPIYFDLTAPVVTLNLSGIINYGASNYTSDLHNIHPELTVSEPESGPCASEYQIIDSMTGNAVTSWTDWSTLQQTVLTNGGKYRIKIRVKNQAQLITEVQSSEIVLDNTPPENLTLNGPQNSPTGGEQVVFSAAAVERDSTIAQYRLAIMTLDGTDKLTALVPGNQDGWMIQNTNASAAQFRIELPSGHDGNYYPVLEAQNAAGLVTRIIGEQFAVNSNQERVYVSDQGPYTMFGDHLTGIWKYGGLSTVSGYRFRIVDGNNQAILDWRNTAESSATITGLQLENGKTYRFEVQAVYQSGAYSNSGFSQGVTVDTTKPEITKLESPAYSTSNNLHFLWEGQDPQSQIVKAQIAVGTDYYQTDISHGWIIVTGNLFQVICDASGNPLHLESGKRYYLTLRLTNGAGLQTEMAAQSVVIDDAAPPIPQVTDQGAYINPGKQPLEAQWIWTPVDLESGPANYQWALVTNPQKLDTVNWADVGQTNRIIYNDNASLQNGQTYYFVVKSTNQAGLTSIGYSNGIMIDFNAPIIPKVTLLQAINLSQDKQEALYITTNQNLELSIDSIDGESGLGGYDYAYGSQASVEQAPKTASDVPNIQLDSPQINQGEITVFKADCFDKADNASQPGYSPGVVLDTGAPQIMNVRGSVTGNQMLFDWDVKTSVSPVAYYEVILVPTDQSAISPSSGWIKVGLSRSFTIDGKDMADGKYRLLIRAYNQAGTCSRRQAGLDEWGISPEVMLDRTPPVMDAAGFGYDLFASDSLHVQVRASDNLSGINGYQYALGTQTDPYQFSNGWVDVATVNSGFEIVTSNIPQGTKVFLMVRVNDNVGLWSEPLISQAILIDHTPALKPVVTSGSYTQSKTEIFGVGFVSDDPESGITHYKIGIVKQIGGEWLISNIYPITPQFDGKLTGLGLEEDGIYYIAVQVQNGAGDWSEIGYSNAIKVDTVPPVLQFPKGSDTLVLNQPPLNIEYTLSEDARVKLILTDDQGNSKEFSLIGKAGSNTFMFIEAIPATYNLTAQPTDLAGNPGSLPNPSQSVRVNDPPQISLVSQFNATPGAPVQLTASITDSDGYPDTIIWDPGDGGPVLTGTNPVYHYTKVGQYTVTVTVTDNDGGTSSATTKVIIGNTTNGTLFIDETWSGTHRLYGDVTVPQNITLTILPGTQVIVDGNPDNGYDHALIINGGLNIQGIQGQEASFSSVDNGPGGWKGIYLQGRANISGVRISNAQRALTILGQVTVADSIFADNLVGIHVYGVQPSIANCQFLNNTWYGIKEDAEGNPVVTNCSFQGNGIDYYDEALTRITMDKLNSMPGNSGNQFIQQ